MVGLCRVQVWPRTGGVRLGVWCVATPSPSPRIFCIAPLDAPHPRLTIGYTPYRRLYIPSEHQVVVSLIPVLLILLSAGGGEVLRASAQRLLHKHPMSHGFPGIEPLLNQLPCHVGCGDMLVLLQYHHLEENELLQVPLSVPHPTHIVAQGPNKAAPYNPDRIIINLVSSDCLWLISLGNSLDQFNIPFCILLYIKYSINNYQSTYTHTFSFAKTYLNLFLFKTFLHQFTQKLWACSMTYMFMHILFPKVDQNVCRLFKDCIYKIAICVPSMTSTIKRNLINIAVRPCLYLF